MTILLGILACGKSALSWLLSAIKEYPWQCAVIALVALSAWLWTDRAGIQDDLASERTARKADQAEWEGKVAAANTARDKAKTDAKEASTDAQEYHEKLVAANDGLDDYISSHRVQPSRQCPGLADSAIADSDPAVHADTPAVSNVEVSEGDVMACDEAWSYAQSAYQFGQDLISKGLAVKE